MEVKAYAGHYVSMLVKKDVSHRDVLILVDGVTLSIGKLCLNQSYISYLYGGYGDTTPSSVVVGGGRN